MAARTTATTDPVEAQTACLNLLQADELHPPYTHLMCPRAQVGFFNAGMVRAKHVTAMMMQMLVAMSVRRLRLAICMQQGRAAGPCTHGRVMHAAVKEPLSYSHSRKEGLAIGATWRQDL